MNEVLIISMLAAASIIFLLSQTNMYLVAGQGLWLDVAATVGLPMVFGGSTALVAGTLVAGITITLFRRWWKYNKGYMKYTIKGPRWYLPTKYDKEN